MKTKTWDRCQEKMQADYERWLKEWNSRTVWREDIKVGLASKGLEEKLAEQCSRFIDHQHFPQLTDEENNRVKAWAAMYVEHELPFIGVLPQPWHILVLVKGFVYGAAFSLLLEEERKGRKSQAKEDERKATPDLLNLEYFVNWARAKYFKEKE